MQLQKKLSITVIFFLSNPVVQFNQQKETKKPETQIASQTKRINIFGLSTF